MRKSRGDLDQWFEAFLSQYQGKDGWIVVRNRSPVDIVMDMCP
jgi:hypothetical protein